MFFNHKVSVCPIEIFLSHRPGPEKTICGRGMDWANEPFPVPERPMRQKTLLEQAFEVKLVSPIWLIRGSLFYFALFFCKRTGL